MNIANQRDCDMAKIGKEYVFRFKITTPEGEKYAQEKVNFGKKCDRARTELRENRNKSAEEKLKSKI